MPETINWTINWMLNLQVVGGPKMTAPSTINVQAYDVIKVVVPGGPSGTPGKAIVEVQPSDSNQVKVLLISSDHYDGDATYKLSYSVTNGVDNVKLDAQQFFVGEGAVSLLDAAPKTIEFSNASGDGNDVSISILVGRDAIPPSP